MSSATDTLSGNYGMAKLILPDGSETEIPAKLVTKVVDGKNTSVWVAIDERIRDYEAAQAKTEFPSPDLAPSDTEAVTKLPTDVTGKPTTITTHSELRKEISMDLLKFLGDPDPIIQNKCFPPEKLAMFKQHPLSVTMARSMCFVYGGKWAVIAQYLPRFHHSLRDIVPAGNKP